MTRFVLVIAAVGLAVSWAPASAHGQTLNVCINSFGDREDDEFECDILNVPVGIDECEANPMVDFEVRNVPRDTASALDFWRAEGNDCSPTMERDGTDDTCVHLGFSVEVDGVEVPVSVRLQELIDCELEQAGITEQIYIFAGTSSPERGDVPYGVLRIAVDTRRPPAPTDVEGGTGQAAIPVTWRSPGSDLLQHNVYVVPAGETLMGTSPDAGTPSSDAGTPASDAGPSVDAGGATDAGTADASIPDGAVGVAHDGSIHDATIGTFDDAGGGGTGSGDCDMSGIEPGVVPEGVEPTLTVSGDQRRAEIDATALGLVAGDSAAVVVTAVDKAGNESPISEAACIEVVEVVTFCERVGCGDDGCSCAAAGAARDGRSGPWALGLASSILGIAAWRRRRRRQ